EDHGVYKEDHLVSTGDREQVHHERGQPVVDRRGDGELPDGVEPRGGEAPAGPAVDRGPVVERARGGEAGGELRQAGGDREGAERHQRPAHAHHQRTAAAQAVAVEGDAAGEDADHREREREVGEAAHVAEQLLRVAQPPELRRVRLPLPLRVGIHRQECTWTWTWTWSRCGIARQDCYASSVLRVVLAFTCLVAAAARAEVRGFVKVDGDRFVIDGKPFSFVG